MKTYYLVAEKDAATGGYTVNVRDNARGVEVLKTFEASSYSDAVKMFSFSAANMGKAVYCGVSRDGKLYHGEA